MLNYYILSSILILLASQAVVSEAAEKQVSLSQALAIAMEMNHEIRATKSALLAQKAEVGIARGFLLPQIGLEQRVTRTNNPPGVFMSKLNQERFNQTDFNIDSLNHPDPITDLQTMVTVDQAIFIGKVFVGLDIAKKEYAAKGEDYERKREEVALKVSQTYLAIGTAKEYVAVARAGIDDATEHLRITETRYKNGLGPYSDVLRAKTALIEAEQRMVTANRRLTVAKKGLAILLGTSESLDIASDEKIQLPLREMEYYQNGAALRKDLKALRIRYENAKNGVRLADSKYLPTVGVRGSYQINDQNTLLGTEGKSWWLIGVVRWELFDGASREYERSKARHKQAETEEQLKGLAQTVSFGITEAYLAALEAQKNTELSREALASAEEGKKLVVSRFRNSLSPIVDLLDVQLNVDHTRANVVARDNEYRFALIRLAYESGTILDDLGVK